MSEFDEYFDLLRRWKAQFDSTHEGKFPPRQKFQNYGKRVGTTVPYSKAQKAIDAFKELSEEEQCSGFRRSSMHTRMTGVSWK